ncbi:MAG: hypothetical protein AABY22_29735 [Nanoarchaeota archaeon]
MDNPNRIVRKVSWEEFDKLIDELVVKIKEESKNYLIDGIIGIPRGGLVVAVCLSHKLNIQLITETQFNDDSEGKIVIVCDDICDKGNTLNNFLMNNKKHDLILTTLHYREGASITPIYAEKINEEWIQYPWEIE